MYEIEIAIHWPSVGYGILVALALEGIALFVYGVAASRGRKIRGS